MANIVMWWKLNIEKKREDGQGMNEMSDLSTIYGELSEEQEIFIMPVRMKEEKLYIPSDDEEFAILIADYFLVDHPLMLFAPKLVMEAWFFAGRRRVTITWLAKLLSTT